MTRDFVADLAACEKATPGPWEADDDKQGRVWQSSDDHSYISSCKHSPPHDSQHGAKRLVGTDDRELDQRYADAKFIAAARSAMPAALGLIKRIHVYATTVAADSDSTEDERSLMINIKYMIADEYGDTVK